MTSVNPHQISRRRLLQFAGGAILLACAPASAAAGRERIVKLRNLHTGESLKSTYWVDDQVNEAEMAALSSLLRDHRTGEVHAIDVGVVHILWTLQRLVDNAAAYEVISGYRSPATNARLNAKNKGVAKRSLHMQGRAIDVRLPGTELRLLRDAAIELGQGGVGYYARSDFVHLDTGRFRTW